MPTLTVSVKRVNLHCCCVDMATCQQPRWSCICSCLLGQDERKGNTHTHTHLTKLSPKSLGISSVKVLCTNSCPSRNTGMDLHCIDSLHSIQCSEVIPCLPTFYENEYEQFWINSCRVEFRDLCFNHADTDRFSEEGQPALLLRWHGNMPAAPMILQILLSSWWIRGRYERKNDTYISLNCLQNVWSVVQSKSLHRLIYIAFTPFTAFNVLTPQWPQGQICDTKILSEGQWRSGFRSYENLFLKHPER